MFQNIDLPVQPNLDDCFRLQKEYSLKLRVSSASQRIQKLKQLKDWIVNNKKDIQKAVYADFRKPVEEIDLNEIYLVLKETSHAIKNLKKWMRPKKVKTPLIMLGSNSEIQYEPKGSALIISPWNYPFSLAIGPLVSALAAGCTVILKPSEMTPHTSALIRRMALEVFEIKEVTVVEGGVEVARQLVSKPFDHIFFTGSPAVGKTIMKSASEHLTSVTLELGGKSPAVIDKTCDILDTCQKIAWGKFINCGQTCIAPDYLIVHQDILEQFVSELKIQIQKMYGPGFKDFEKGKGYARIINLRHLKRLTGLLADANAKGASVLFGGKIIEEDNFMEPTILGAVNDNMHVMQEEIFGPILPIVPAGQLEEITHFINSKPKPLALYVFSQDKFTVDYILGNTSSGSACVNDCLIQFMHPELPFGGINHSGIGKSHGLYGFLAFSNEKAVLKQRVGLTSIKNLYPPYGFKEKKISEALLKWF